MLNESVLMCDRASWKMPSKADSLVRSLDVLLCKGLRDFGVLFLAHRSRDFGIPRKWSLDPALGKGCRIGGRRPSQKVKVLKLEPLQLIGKFIPSRRPSQKVKVLKQESVGSNPSGLRRSSRRPSQKVKVLKHHFR